MDEPQFLTSLKNDPSCLDAF